MCSERESGMVKSQCHHIITDDVDWGSNFVDGWFGFNAGSNLEATSGATLTFRKYSIRDLCCNFSMDAR